MTEQQKQQGRWARRRILVNSDCHNKCHRLHGLHNRNLFPSVLAVGSPRWTCQQGRFPFKTSCLCFQAATIQLCAHILSSLCKCVRKKLSGVSSYKGAHPIVRAPPSWPYLILITSPKPHHQIISQWNLEPQHITLWETHWVPNKKCV